jgi:YD repeat-containing protein
VESGGTRLTYPDGTYITYDYDELNRLTAVRDSFGTAPCLCRGRLWPPIPSTAGPAGRPDPRLREDDNITATQYEDNPVIPAKAGSGQSEFGVPRLRGSDWSLPPEGGTPNGDGSGTRTHVYSYGDIMSLRAKRGNQYTAAGSVYYQHDASGKNRLIQIREHAYASASMAPGAMNTAGGGCAA